MPLRVQHAPSLVAPFDGVHGLRPPHLHARRSQLRCYQLPGPDPARLLMPERGRIGRQARCTDLRRAGRGAVVIGGVRGQTTFAGEVVFQNTGLRPIGTALQKCLCALQRGLHPHTRDAREHVVVR